MKLRQIYESWNARSANDFLVKFRQDIKPTGFKVKVVGSVATQGFSENDLDLLLSPTRKTEQWAEEFGETHEDPLVIFLNTINYEVHAKSEDLLTISLNDGRIVDLFIEQ